MDEKGPSKGQKSKFRKTEKNLFSHSPKEYISKILGCWVENCDLQLGNRQTDKKAKTERSPFRAFGVTSLQPIIKERSNYLQDIYFLFLPTSRISRNLPSFFQSHLAHKHFCFFHFLDYLEINSNLSSFQHTFQFLLISRISRNSIPFQ